MALPKRDWLDMTWQDIAGAATARWIAVLPLAAVEQHGPHLPLGVDSFIADAYLKRVREILPQDLPSLSFRHSASAFRPSTWPIQALSAFRPRPRSPHGPSLARASRVPGCASSFLSPATAATSPPWNWWHAICARGTACWR